MPKYLLLLSICISLMACNLGTAQQMDDGAIPVTQITATPQPQENSDFPDDVREHILAIFAQGQAEGNRSNVFSKIGDSITVSRSFLYPFGIGSYNLGDYSHLENLISAYAQSNAHIGNSFINESLAAGEGWSARAVLTASFADETYCQAGEIPLFCEYRLVRPSIAIIMFGTNDVGYRTPDEFGRDMQTIITYTEGMGIIPILSTIPNRPDVAQRVVIFNDVIRQLALDNHLPLIELYEETIALPNSGLTVDNVHLSSPPAGISATGSFDLVNLQYGYVMRNFVTLQVLYAVDRLINA